MTCAVGFILSNYTLNKFEQYVKSKISNFQVHFRCLNTMFPYTADYILIMYNYIKNGMP